MQGVKIKSPRKDEQPFHVTIGWLKGPLVPQYRFRAALADVNAHSKIEEWPFYRPSEPHLQAWATDDYDY